MRFDFAGEPAYENVTKEEVAMKQAANTSAEEPIYYNQAQQTPNEAPDDTTYENNQTSQVSRPTTEDGTHYNQIQENLEPRFSNTPPRHQV